MILYFCFAFFSGWLVASMMLSKSAVEAAAVCFHEDMNAWREILESALQSGSAQREEKIRFVVTELRHKLGAGRTGLAG